jgi:thioredoxin 1
MPIDITKENFDREVMASDIPVLAYFHLPNCARCLAFSGYGEGLEKNNAGKLKLVKFNIMQNQKLAKALGVASAPSFIVFQKGEQIEQFFGDRVNKEIIEDFMDRFLP